MDSDNTWLVGAGMNVLGSILVNLGTNVLKLGHNELVDTQSQHGTPSTKRSNSQFAALQNTTWLFGFSVFMAGNVLNFISFGFAAQSLLAALGSVQFVCNVLFARFVLDEEVALRTYLATVVIIAGNVLLVVFGNQESKEYTLAELQALYEAPMYLIYIACTLSVCAISLGLFNYIEKQIAKNCEYVDYDDGYALPLTYAVYAGSLGTQSIVFSKSVSLLMRQQIQGTNVFVHWQTFVFLLAFLFFATFWVTRLNKGLMMFRAVLIVPMLQVIWTVLAIIGGGIYFQEFNTFSLLQGIMFATGVLVVMFGVYLLCPPSSVPAEDQDIASKFYQGAMPSIGETSPSSAPLPPKFAARRMSMETRVSEDACGQDEEGGAHPMRTRSSTITMMKDDVKDAIQIFAGQGMNRQMRALSAFAQPMASIALTPNKTARHNNAAHHRHMGSMRSAGMQPPSRFKSAFKQAFGSPIHIVSSECPMPHAAAGLVPTVPKQQAPAESARAELNHLNPFLDQHLLAGSVKNNQARLDSTIAAPPVVERDTMPHKSPDSSPNGSCKSDFHTPDTSTRGGSMYTTPAHSARDMFHTPHTDAFSVGGSITVRSSDESLSAENAQSRK